MEPKNGGGPMENDSAQIIIFHQPIDFPEITLK